MTCRARFALALLVPVLTASRGAAGQAPPSKPLSEPPTTAAIPESAVGSICVLRHLLPEQMPRRGADSLPPTRTYAIRLDGGPWVPLSTKTDVLLAGIPRAGRHKVAIRGDGKPYTAFTLRFDPKGPDALCLYQSDMYQTWQVRWTKQSFKQCRCQGIEPSAWQPAHP